MFDCIKKEAEALQNEMVVIRRQIHRNPELGFAEWETSALVHSKLSGLGLQIKGGIAKTGIAAVLHVNDEWPTVALRADMDALPIEEQNDTPYKSEKPGIMHACGHDAHVAMLIGAAKVLTKIRSRLKCNVKFIFQPCEEQPRGGAEPMIREGVLDNPVVDLIFGLHVNPYLQAEFIGLKEGLVMAAADQFKVEIIGKGGHGAAPHQTIDPILVASHIVQALQAVVSRQTDPIEPVVVSVCAINGGQSYNVIADRVMLNGTVRTMNPQVQQYIPEKIRNIIRGITSAYGAGFNFDYQWGYPALVNNGKAMEAVRVAATEITGRQRVVNISTPSMGAEDFACFTGRVPGAYFFLGVKKPGAEVYPWHNPRFDIDESALSTGAAVLAGCAVQGAEILRQKEDGNEQHK